MNDPLASPLFDVEWVDRLPQGRLTVAGVLALIVGGAFVTVFSVIRSIAIHLGRWP